MVSFAVVASTVAGAVGVGSLAFAAVASDDAGHADRGRIWIDGPLPLTSIAPGPVRVSAHASAADRIDDLVLDVDGEPVDSTAQVERNDTLVFAVFDWDAEPGPHVLVVRRSGEGGARSAERVVVVGTTDAPAPTPAEPSRTPQASAAPPTAPTAPPTSAPPTSAPTSSSPSARPSRTPRPTPRPSRPPRPTSTPSPTPDPPVIDGAGLGEGPVYQNVGCAYQVVVSARVRGATRVSVVVEGTGRSFAMTGDGASWTAAIGSGWDAAAIGSHTVTVRAEGAGGTTSRSVGTLTVRPGCPKD